MSVEDEQRISVEDSVRAAFSELEDDEKAQLPEGEDVESEGEEIEELEDDSDEEELAASDDEEVDEGLEEELELEEPEEEEVPVELLEAPAAWSAEEREIWGDLPRKAQEAVVRRHKEDLKFLTQKSQAFSEYNKQVAPILDTLNPHADYLAMNGVDPVLLLNQAIAQHKQFRENPQEALKQVANLYGVNVPSEERGSVPQQPYQDPRVDQLLQMQQQQAEQAAIAQEEETRTAIDSFRVETDGSGKLLRPYFDEVKTVMGSMMQVLGQEKPTASMTELLHEAYDRAVFASPDVRTKIQQDQKQKSEHARMQEAKKRASRAKKKSRPAKRSSKADRESAPRHQTWEQAVAAAYDSYES